MKFEVQVGKELKVVKVEVVEQGKYVFKAIAAVVTTIATLVGVLGVYGVAVGDISALEKVLDTVIRLVEVMRYG